MEPFNGDNEFLFMSDDSNIPLTHLSETTIALDFGQSQYPAAWSQQPMPNSPFYDQITPLSSQVTLQNDYQMHQNVVEVSQLMIAEASGTTPIIASVPLSPNSYPQQQLFSNAFPDFDQGSSTPVQDIAMDSTIDHQDQASDLLLNQPTFPPAAQYEDDQISWSASTSSSSNARERSKQPSSPQEAPAMQKKSSATQCELCEKWVVDMKKHRESHEETRAAKCPLAACAYTAKGMSRINDIKRHVVAQHWTQGLFCVFCPGARGEPGLHFEKAQAFRTHMRNVHAVQNRGTRDALKMPDTLRSDGSHGHCQVCQLEMKNYQHLHDHLEPCIRRQLVVSQDVDEINVRNLADVPSPQLSSSTGLPGQTSDSHAARQLKRSGMRDSTLALRESANAGNIGPHDPHDNLDGGAAAHYPASWHGLPSDVIIMHRTVIAYDGPKMVHKEGMFYEV